MSALLNSFQTVVILMVISRIDNVYDAGTFVIAYAVANLLVMIGRYGVRQFQASDITEQYNFKEYLILRVFTSIFMILIGFTYILYLYFTHSYDLKKAIIVLLICCFRIIDAFEDVFHGMYQQHGRLDVAGKILTIRYSIYIIEYMFLYYVTHNLLLTTAICVFTTFLFALFLNNIAYKSFHYKCISASRKKIYQLSLDCLPIFISTFLMTYIGNAPKYSIDVVLSSQDQALFNYIFMPVFIISLMSTFIYQPMISQLSTLWISRDLRRFWRLILRQSFLIILFALLALLGGWFLGIPVLSILYNVNLSPLKAELIILLLGGGCLALVNFFTMVVTVTRYQSYLIGGYLFISFIFLAFGRSIAINYNIMGICIFYTLANFILACIFLVLIFVIAKLSTTLDS